MKITLVLEITVRIFKEGKQYVSYCPELDLASCGKTYKQAEERFKEALSLFLDEAEAMGTLREILVKANAKEIPLDTIPSHKIYRETVKMKIPHLSQFCYGV